MPRLEEKYSSYFITVNPNPSRVHSNKRFDHRSHAHQMALIHTVINKSLRWCQHEETTIYYELTQKGNVHAHFKVFLTPKKLKLFQIEIVTRLGNPKLAPEICCHVAWKEVWRPKIDPDNGLPFESWEAYCAKGYIAKKITLCQCISCKVQREDKRIMNSIEYGKTEYKGTSTESPCSLWEGL